MVSFPTSLDSFTALNATDPLTGPPIAHHVTHNNLNDAVTAVETKIGVGASTPTANTVLAGNGTGSSAYTTAPSVTTLTVSDSVIWNEEAVPSASGASKARIYADSTLHKLMVSLNNASYASILTSGNVLANDLAASGTNTKFLRGDMSWQSISVALSDASTTPIYTISGSPTVNGTLTITLAAQSGNTIFGSPSNGSSGQPLFRSLIAADIPNLDTGKITTGTINTARLGSNTADNTKFLRGDSTWQLFTSGTVTNVSLADGSTTPIYTISGSPVTGTGTLTFTLASQTGNVILASPSGGGSGQPTFRSLIAADIPNLDSNKITTGTIATARLGSGTADITTFLRGDNTWQVPSGGGGSGTVTSVAFNEASTNPIYTITNSPVTTNGTLTITLSSQTNNTVFASPSNGTSGQPLFRALVANDIPNLDAGKITTGTLGTARLGSGTANTAAFLRGDSSWSNTIVGQFVVNPGGGTGPLTVQLNGSNTFVIDSNGATTHTGAAVAGGATLLTLTIGSHTALTAESIDLNLPAATVQGSSGSTVATDRRVYLASKTYNQSGATFTVTNAYTLYIDPPVSGTGSVNNKWCIGINGNINFIPTSSKISINNDTSLTRVTAASWRLGTGLNGTPVAYTITIGDSSRGGTDTNVAGATGTIQPGLGTGTATPAALILKAPVTVASGTTAQTYSEGFRVQGVSTAIGISFFAASAVIQQAGTGNVHTVAAGATTSVFTNTTFDGSIGSTAYTIGDIVVALKNYGLLA